MKPGNTIFVVFFLSFIEQLRIKNFSFSTYNDKGEKTGKERHFTTEI